MERFFPEIITSEGYSTTLGRPVKHIDLYGLQTVLFAAAQLQLEQHEALSKRMDSSNEDMGKLREELYQELRKVDTTAVTAAARVQRMGRISSILKRRKKLMNEKKTTSAQQQLLHPSILSDLLNRVLSLVRNFVGEFHLRAAVGSRAEGKPNPDGFIG